MFNFFGILLYLHITKSYNIISYHFTLIHRSFKVDFIKKKLKWIRIDIRLVKSALSFYQWDGPNLGLAWAIYHLPTF